MSHFLFGDFYAQNMDESTLTELKLKLLQNDVLLAINDEIDFCDDIDVMLISQGGRGKNQFCLTTTMQKYNSEDLLIPYGNYTTEELFPNGDDRTFFNQMCRKQMTTLKEVMEAMQNVLEISNLRVFVTEGRDNQFSVVTCTLQEMIDDMLSQVIEESCFDSTIYEIVEE